MCTSYLALRSIWLFQLILVDMVIPYLVLKTSTNYKVLYRKLFSILSPSVHSGWSLTHSALLSLTQIECNVMHPYISCYECNQSPWSGVFSVANITCDAMNFGTEVSEKPAAVKLFGQSCDLMMGIAGPSEMSTRLHDVTFHKTIIFINPKRRSPTISLPNSFSRVEKKTLLNLWCKTDSVLTPRSNNSMSFNHSFIHSLIHSVKVKQSRYRPGVAQRVPGS